MIFPNYSYSPIILKYTYTLSLFQAWFILHKYQIEAHKFSMLHFKFSSTIVESWSWFVRISIEQSNGIPFAVQCPRTPVSAIYQYSD